MMPRILLLFLSLVLLNSCVSYNSLLNYEQAPEIPTEPQTITNYKPIVIQTNDILHIQVSSTNEMAAKPFQMNAERSTGGANNAQSLLMNGYLVDEEGKVSFPTLGDVKLGGLTIQAAKDSMLAYLQAYFVEDASLIVNIRLLNFNIVVNGEVGAGGTYTIPSERITILEAITMAGDFTDYSRRDSILVIRESNNIRSFGYVDFNSPDIFNSPYFYLQQNDVVYVRPLKRRVVIVADPISRIFTWVSAATGTTAFILTLFNRNR